MQFRHRLPIAIWLLASFMIAVLLAFAWLFLNKGPLAEPVLNIGMATGLLTIALIIGSHAFGKPCVGLSLEADGIRLNLRYPLKTLHLHYRYDQVKSVYLVESKDSEGDPHFTTRLTLTDCRDIDLAEGSREQCEPVLAQFTTALRGYSQTSAHLQPTEA